MGHSGEYCSVARGAPGMVEFPGTVERLPNGNTLIADGGDELGFGAEVVEVDPLGQVVWSCSEGQRFTHSARMLRNGNVLITDTTNDRVIEVNRKKELVFTSDHWGDRSGRLSDGSHISYPNDAYEMEDNSLFICDRNSNRCLQVDRQGQVIWQYSEGLKHPHNAHPLPNGNVLISDSDRNMILEVSREKKVVWSYGDGSKEILNWPRCAARLENGNTMICDSKNARVIEVSHKGEKVWEFKVNYFAKFYDIQVLQNNHVLVSDQQHHQVIELDRWGNYLWLFRNYRMIGPILPKLMNGSFKERAPDGLPMYWNFARRHDEGGGKIIWDENNKPYPCPGLEFDRHGFLYLQQTVAVVPGKRYKMAARIRTEGVKGSCSLMMCFLDKYGGQVYDMEDIPRGDLYIGDNDWTLDVAETVAPEAATSAELRLYINGGGKAWMKEVMFHSA
ncbi:MAG: hypothetical protein JXL84_13350 [Deltaproteobacteria bacterium]|nr:hypothetical protein [Deltaproteobacteria bacterium]